MKKNETKKNAKRITKFFRFSEKDWNRIAGLAKLYSKGNVTQWVTYQAINGERRHLR